MTAAREVSGSEHLDVLVVDDDPLMRRILLTALSTDGHRPAAASDGDEAWDHVQREWPRLIVTDWEMPGLSGPELVRRVRAADRAYVYIILLTVRSELDDILEGMDAGADDYLAKPLNPRELRARVAIGKRVLALEDRLTHLASTDGPTGPLNRRANDERARAELDRGPRVRLRYPAEVRERAVRLVLEHQSDYPSKWAAIRSIAANCGMTAETLRTWVRSAEVHAGARPRLTSDER